MRRIPAELGKKLGLLRVRERSEAHVLLRIPAFKESVFRGAVIVAGIRTCDVLQAWLDVSHDPARGHQQADHLYRHVIGPRVKRASA